MVLEHVAVDQPTAWVVGHEGHFDRVAGGHEQRVAPRLTRQRLAVARKQPDVVSVHVDRMPPRRAVLMFTVLPRLGVVANSAIMNVEPIVSLALAWAILGMWRC